MNSLTCAHQRSDIAHHVWSVVTTPPPLHAYSLNSIEMGVARTLSERTDDNGDRLDRECGLALPRSYSYGYGGWYIPSIGNDKAISNLKLIV